MTFTLKRIEQLNNGYGLDGGGYSFENIPSDHPLTDKGVIWDDPDLDYFLGADIVPHEHRNGLCMVLVFNVGAVGAPEFPEYWLDSDGDCMLRVCFGWVSETDRECNCHGEPNDVDGCWGFTGDTSDKPYPECDRCDGDGYVTSDGGTWAIYVMTDEDEEGS